MKISPVPSSITPTIDTSGNPQPTRVDTLRLKMQTNATPLPNQEFAQGLPISSINNSAAEPAVEATQPISPQLALLAKQRRALQVKRREVEARERALSQQTGNAGIDVAQLKSDPIKVLLDNGVTYQQLTDALMANQGSNEINALKAEIESLKQGIDNKFSEKEAASEKQVLAEMRREAERLSNDDAYELVREKRGVPKVMELIERTYRETGEVLDVSEALTLVEDELFEDAKKMTRLKKLQALMAPPIVQPQQRQTGMRTLTNRDTASVPMSSKQRAMAAFYGNLKR